MAADLDTGIEIVGVPAQRDDDGLALSSRNVYLDDEDRLRAVALPRALGVAARAIGRGVDAEDALTAAREMILAAGYETIDYMTVVDAETLQPSADLARPLRVDRKAQV